MIKVVVWDLDGTLWPGVALESPETPVVFPAVVRALDTLASRGILLSVASRNPESVGEWLPPDRFVSPQLGFGRKVDALRRIADDLDVGLDTLAFVDDDPMERADVERTLPSVVVLAPDEVADALDWPEFSPGPVTDAARGRLESYRRRAARRTARSAFGGSEEDFLRWCGLRAVVRPATPADTDRLAELARRTTQYNSTGAEWTGGPALVLELADRFGDDGLVGLAALPPSPGPEPVGPAGDAAGTGWPVPLLAVSCRAGGRGAVPVLLTAVARRAAVAGAARVEVPCRLTERNVPVRLGLKQAGFTAVSRAGDVAVFALPVPGPPSYPDWIAVREQP